ncbi:hypothetical protein TrST_g13779 [Triparma strigata]|uniref:Uncharacterized protein n=1 Tax=Triparma strigata TaxID=1606541 RepID=A0A9W7ED61_9STRA|nr:hypothetical protein TrST_g13779 [Triparma strigata]
MAADEASAWSPPKWVKLVAVMEMSAVFATGYVALILNVGLVTCGSDSILCIPTLGTSPEAASTQLLRGWGGRQACIFVPFACAIAWNDRNVYRAAFACFIARCLNDLLAIAIEGFADKSALSFGLVASNCSLASVALYRIWKSPSATVASS